MPSGVEWGLLKLNGALVQITTSSRRTDLIALPSTPSVPYAAAVSNRLTPNSRACWMMAIASASLLPCASPSWLNPPQPSPATLTRKPVLPSVVYSIRHLPSVSACFRRLEGYIAHSAAPPHKGLSSSAKIRNVGEPHLAARRGDHTRMRIDQAVNIEDLHRMAKRRLPKIAFDFIEGGIEDERGLETNTSAFHKHKLLPRYLVDVFVSRPRSSSI